jgi:hypothetical protein
MAPLKIRNSESLTGETTALMADLAEMAWAADTYLAGSAALALYLGHRPVRDLDLMSSVLRLRSVDRRDILQDLLEMDPACRVETARDGFLYTRAGSGVGLRLFYYPYPLVDSEAEYQGLAVASPVDLGLMKLGAIISRGTRRDFVDLYLLCQELPLTELLEASAAKYGHVGDFPVQALKGLSDLSQTEGEPMPTMSAPVDWEEVTAWTRNQVESLGRERVGLNLP